MRDLLNLLDQINETILMEKSRGLLYRDPGDKFIQGDPKNPSGEMTFVGVEYFPSNPGKYEDYNDMALAAQKIVLNYPGIQYVNTPNNGTHAFAIITLRNKDGSNSYICRFFKLISTDMTGQWKNNDIPGGWQLAKSSSLKASYGLKPADLFPANVTFNSPLELLHSLTGNSKVADLMPGLQMLLANKLPVFKDAESMLSAIQDDLGEIIAPIALAQGLITDAGAEAAKNGLLNGNDWSGLSINFPTAKNNGLVDSYVIVDGIEVGISSKGKSGAKASIKNVSDGINIAKTVGTPEQKKTISRYAKQIAVLDEIAASSTLDFPVVYAVNRGLISARIGEKISQLVKSGVKTLNQDKSLTVQDREILEEFMDRMASKGAANYSVGYHVLAVLAGDVATHINEDPLFGEMCLFFVNVNPIIQIYLTAAKKGNDVVVTKLTSLYPPNFQGTILVESGKSYFASGTSGKMVFSYRPNKETAAAGVSKAAALAQINKQTIKKVNHAVDPRVNITPLGSEKRKVKKVPEPTGGRQRKP